jgi:hypothetical protein
MLQQQTWMLMVLQQQTQALPTLQQQTQMLPMLKRQALAMLQQQMRTLQLRRQQMQVPRQHRAPPWGPMTQLPLALDIEWFLLRIGSMSAASLQWLRPCHWRSLSGAHCLSC